MGGHVTHVMLTSGGDGAAGTRSARCACTGQWCCNTARGLTCLTCAVHGHQSSSASMQAQQADTTIIEETLLLDQRFRALLRYFVCFTSRPTVQIGLANQQPGNKHRHSASVLVLDKPLDLLRRLGERRILCVRLPYPRQPTPGHGHEPAWIPRVGTAF